VTPVLPFRLKARGTDEVAAWHVRSLSYRLHGLARLEPRTLILQWSGTAEVSEVKGTAVREYEERIPVREVMLPVAQVASLTLHGRWWRPRVVLRVTDLTILGAVPGSDQGVVTLWIAGRDWPLAVELITGLEIEQADAALAAAEGPPPLPPQPSA